MVKGSVSVAVGLRCCVSVAGRGKQIVAAAQSMGPLALDLAALSSSSSPWLLTQPLAVSLRIY